MRIPRSRRGLAKARRYKPSEPSLPKVGSDRVRSAPPKKRVRKCPWLCAKEAWFKLNQAHSDSDNRRQLHWKFVPPVSGQISVPVTPPTAFIRGMGWNPHLFRFPIKKLSFTQQQYMLLIRMIYILRFFGIKYRGLPSKLRLQGLLRTCATKITQIGFSMGQVLPHPQAKDRPKAIPARIKDTLPFHER
jgi:hypothetical protein